MRFFKILRAGWVLALALIFLVACRQRVRYLKSPPHYNFGMPFKDKLDLKVQEISGIVWDSRNNEFICHNDEFGTLYFLEKESHIIKKEINFGKKGDYEDLALYKGQIYVLRSDGMLTKIITDSSGKSYGVEAGRIGLSGNNDFETLYFDPSRNALIMICKNCALDKKTGKVSAFAFYPDSIGFVPEPVFTIDLSSIEKVETEKTSRFQPSAAAVHPELKRLFILSSASSQLAIADLSGNIESIYVLSKKMFPQPEGITFKNNGDMYITNEGISSKATMIKFLYTP